MSGITIDELAEREGSKWANLDCDTSRPITDMLGIIHFQRDAGERAHALEQHTAAFSHYSRAKYALSMLRYHPSYNRLSPKEIAGLAQTSDYINKNLPVIVNCMPQSHRETIEDQESDSDQPDTDGEEEYSFKGDSWPGSSSYTSQSRYQRDMQPFPPMFTHQRDSAPQQNPFTYTSSHSVGAHERSGYDRISNSRRTGGAVGQASTPWYPPPSSRQAEVEDISHDNDYLAGLAPSFLQLSINPPPIVSAPPPLAPQPQYSSAPNNRVATSRASSRGPPSMAHEGRDIVRSSTASGDFRRANLNPPIFNELHSLRPDSPQDYYTAPTDGMRADRFSGEGLQYAPHGDGYRGPAIKPMRWDPYSGSEYVHNPERGNYHPSRPRNLSAVSLSRNIRDGTGLIHQQPTITTQTGWYSSAHGHPSRRRSLSDSGMHRTNTKNPDTSTLDSLDYYTAELELRTAFEPRVAATFAHEPIDYHPETINNLEEDGIDQMEQANWQQAEILLKDVLERRRHTQGNSHLLTLQSMSNLGWAYQGQGKLKDAVTIFSTALRELRSQHPDADQGIRLDIERRLQIARSKLGDHTDYAYSTRSTDTHLNALASGTNSLYHLRLQPMIGSNTSPDEIIAHLTSRGCPDLTRSLDSARCERTNSSGGYGEIWRGVLSTNKRVALKQLYSDPKMNKRLCHELYTWSKTHHQNILELLGIAWFQDRLVMISPWMDGGNLEEYVRKYPEVDRLTISLQVVNGVDYLHGLPLVHGDLKARNIFISGDGTVKIGDFGLAALLCEQSLKFSITGNQLGTLSPKAPELFQSGREKDCSSDVYALGMTLLEIFSGDLPFCELESLHIVHAVAVEHRKPLLPSGISRMGERGGQLWDVLNACWEWEPSNRPNTAWILQEIGDLLRF
ncbi:unnamed protein product [Rhizoctonia solani]|uniref:Protein kinase domain-containing protein n=1 Tax=Rhizoctonia solani TaxID=456999 RepID=A0A8H3D0Q2_9AGAM|nr:unnamed protein product [Rhizoctonia solani]